MIIFLNFKKFILSNMILNIASGIIVDFAYKQSYTTLAL